MSAGYDARRVRKVMTTRTGGFSAEPFGSFNLAQHVGDRPEDVARNRASLAERLNLPEESFVWMEQTHSTNVQIIESLPDGPLADTDAIVTNVPGIALTVLVADCVPVLLWDETVGVIAAAHAGRQGARDGVVKKTVEAMQSLGAVPMQIHGLLGPAACGAEYEVPEEMAADVEKHLPGSRTLTLNKTPGLDIRQGVQRQLRDLGVVSVDIMTPCTITDERFFSYRRERLTGRHAGVIVLDD